MHLWITIKLKLWLGGKFVHRLIIPLGANHHNYVKEVLKIILTACAKAFLTTPIRSKVMFGEGGG